jgi:hypothetical protein
MNRRRFISAAIAASVASANDSSIPVAAQQQFPARATIRGENVRVRAEPADAAANNAVLQRGDAIILMGPLEAHPDGEFYPVEVPSTGATGWVLWVFIDPRTIAPMEDVVIEEPPVETPEPEPTEEPNGGGRRRRGGGQELVASVSGVGVSVSDPFSLTAGRYRVSASVDVSDYSGFACQLHGPDGYEELIFNELIETPQLWTGSTVVTLGADGEYFVEVSNTDAPWTIEFSPA